MLILAFAIIAAGAALQTATGMGMALFAAPLLALLDPAFAPAPTLCAVGALSAAVAWRGRAAVDRNILTLALLGLTAGSILGAGLLAVLAGRDLSRLFGGLILAAIALIVLGLNIRANRPALLLGGLASGVLGTMSGVQGPPIALVLQHEPPERLRATLCAFFAIGTVLSVVAMAATGVFGLHQLRLSLELLPGVPVGLLLGRSLVSRIDQRRARLCVLTISALSAVALLLR